MKNKTFRVEGEDYIEKFVQKHGATAGRVYLPAAWVGKRVAIIRLPELATV